MYTDWFKLKRLPFRLRPDPDFLDLTGETATVYESLRATVASGRGLVSLVGEAGVGKTTLLHALAEEHQGAMSIARIQHPNITVEELLDALREQFGLPTEDPETRDTLAQLHQFVAEEADRGRSVLILVDEAHYCSAATLRELLELVAHKPAPVLVVAGERGLLAQLAALELHGMPVKPLAALRLPRLSAAGTERYLASRLEVAGGNGRALFDPEALAEIQRYTGGTPQLINMLCDNAMVLAETHSNQRVSANDIRDAVQELKWVEFTARSPEADELANPLPAPAARDGTLIPVLDVQLRGRPVSRLHLRPGRLVVGRAEDAGLRLDSQFVSRQHCQIITTAEQSFVEDLGSTNGILVNGKRRRMHHLVSADRIVIGDHTLTYLEVAEGEPVSELPPP